jgi:RimJ/RimL family protein N-acetyltransferase
MDTLETDRLVLRPFREADFEAYAAYYQDESAARYVGGVMDRPRAWRHMAAILGHWVLRGFGLWAVDERDTGDFVGCIGVQKPEGWPELELGWWLVRSAHGRGYATEGGARARRHAYETLGAQTLVSYIHPVNAASIRVAERLGAHLERTEPLLDFGPHHVYRHPPPG